ncbi:MAG: hydrogen peroxide-inducible genes activator [Flavobacteriales bacterium]|nr:hydrogen peroxide-inducible genes activator [Flavobacteriales bacterium]
MTLQQLHYIVSVAETGQFSKAARQCHVTQPTLTMMVRKLEDELGVTIFQRGSQPARPTIEGEALIVQARVVLREAGQLKDLVTELRTGTAGTYRLGIIPTLAPYLLPLFLARFADEHPQARLVIDERQTSSILDALRKGQLDVGILAGPIVDDDLEVLTLFHEPFLAYFPPDHPLLEQQRISRDDLHEVQLWVLSEGHCLREQALSVCQHPSSAGHDNILYSTGSIETLKRLVDSGSGITLVPELSVNADEKNVRRFITPEPVREVVLVVRKPFVRRKAVDAFVAAIRAAVPQEFLVLDKMVVPVEL